MLYFDRQNVIFTIRIASFGGNFSFNTPTPATQPSTFPQHPAFGSTSKLLLFWLILGICAESAEINNRIHFIYSIKILETLSYYYLSMYIFESGKFSSNFFPSNMCFFELKHCFLNCFSSVFGAPVATSAPAFGFNTTTTSAPAFGAPTSTQSVATNYGGFIAATSAPTFGFNTATTTSGLGGSSFSGFGPTVPGIGATIPGRFDSILSQPREG